MENKPVEYEVTQQETVVEEKSKTPSTLLKVLVLVVLIGLLVAGVLLPIKLVPNALTSIGSSISTFFKSKENVTLATSKTSIQSGEEFNLTWSGAHKDTGSYIITYTCKDGAYLQTSVSQPNESIPCNTPYYFSAATNSIALTPVTPANKISDIPLTLSFLPNNGDQIEAINTITITVNNTKLTGPVTATTTPVTPKPKPATTTPVTPQPKPTQPAIADLKISLMKIGYLDTNGNFVPSTVIPSGYRAAIMFNVQNIGDKNTGTWAFTAYLPSQSNPVYSSAIQQNIAPGSGVIYTLGFDNIKPSNNKVTITVDSNSSVLERSEVNNTLVTYFGN